MDFGSVAGGVRPDIEEGRSSGTGSTKKHTGRQALVPPPNESTLLISIPEERGLSAASDDELHVYRGLHLQRRGRFKRNAIMWLAGLFLMVMTIIVARHPDAVKERAAIAYDKLMDMHHKGGSKSHSESHTEAVKDGAHNVKKSTKEAAKSIAEEGKEAGKAAKEQAKKAGHYIGSIFTTNPPSTLAPTIQGSGESIGEKTKKTWQAGKEKAQETGGKAKEKGEEAKNKAKEKGEEAKEKAKETGEKAVGTAKEESQKAKDVIGSTMTSAPTEGTPTPPPTPSQAGPMLTDAAAVPADPDEMLLNASVGEKIKSGAEATKEKAKEAGQKIKSWFTDTTAPPSTTAPTSSAAENIKGKVSGTVKAGQGKGQEAADRTKEAGQKVADKTKEEGEEVKDAIAPDMTHTPHASGAPAPNETLNASVGEKIKSGAEATKEKAKEAGEKIKETGEAAKEKTKEGMQKVKSKFTNTAPPTYPPSTASPTISAAENIKGKVAGTVEAGQEKGQEAAGKTKQAAQTVAQKTKEKAEQVKNKITPEYTPHQPQASGGAQPVRAPSNGP